MWNEYGLFARRKNPLDGNYDKWQLKIINNGLYLTNDNWKTIKTGIGKYSYIDPETGDTVEAYGLLADTILGNLILSENVKILNEDSSIKMDKDGFKMIVKVDERGNTETDENGKAKIFSIDKMVAGQNTPTSLLSFSNKGDLDITGNLNAGMVGGFVIADEEIKLSDGEKYSVTEIDNKNYYTRDESGNITIPKFFISPNSGRNFRYKYFEIPVIKFPLYSYINDVKFRLDDTYIGSNGISTSELSAKKIHAGEILAAGKNVSSYMPGDSIEIYNDTPLSAYVSNGRKSIYFSIPLSKSISNTVTAIGLLGVLCGRGITGYLYNYKTRKSEYNLSKAEDEGFTVSCEKGGDSFIKVKITFSNQIKTSSSDDSAAITNNTPASIMAYKPNSTDTSYTDDDYPLRIIFR